MKRLIILLQLMMLGGILGNIYGAAINVPADQPTIQAGGGWGPRVRIRLASCPGPAPAGRGREHRLPLRIELDVVGEEQLGELSVGGRPPSESASSAPCSPPLRGRSLAHRHPLVDSGGTACSPAPHARPSSLPYLL